MTGPVVLPGDVMAGTHAMAGPAELLGAGFDRSRIATALIGLDGRFLRVNDALCRLLGRPRSQLLALPVREVVHPDERAAAMDGYRRLVAGELDRVQATRRYLRGDGSFVSVTVGVVIVRTVDGSPSCAFSQLVDVTEQRRAEERLSRHVTGMRSLLVLSDQLAAAATDYGKLQREAPRAIGRVVGDATALWRLHAEEGCIAPVGWYDAHPVGMRLLDELQDDARLAIGEGLVGRVWACGDPVLATGSDVADVREQLPAAYRLWLSRFGAGSIALVPLRLRGEVTGVLGLTRGAGPPPFRDDDLRVLCDIADRVALALDNARLFSVAEAAAARQAVLLRADDRLAQAALDLDGVLDAVVTTTAEGLGDPCILRLLRGDDASRFGRTVLHHPDPDAAALLRLHLASVSDRVDRGLAGTVITAGALRAQLLDRGSFEPTPSPALEEYLKRYGIASEVGAALRVRGRVIGAILLYRSDASRPFSSEDLALVQALADRAAVAIDNARLFCAVQGSECELRRASEHRRELLDHLVAAQENERRRIAEDVHDDSIQVMAAVDLRLGVLRRRLAALEAGDEVETLDRLQDTVREATGRLRTLLFDLQPPDLHQGLLAAIRQLADTLFETTDTVVEVSGDFRREPVADLGMLLYRIAQEALRNARKHANARSVHVFGQLVDRGYELVVRDDGVGVSEDDLRPQPGHLGVITMRERAQLTGGTLEMSGAPGAGSAVRVWVPDGT